MVSNVTLKDVAAEAGVSAQAVSLVMNEKSKGQLSDATREQVLRAAAKLGYCRNASAGILRGADTKAAAFLTSQRLADMVDEHLVSLVMQTTSSINANGYACFFTELNVPDAGNIQKVRDLLSRGVRRFIVLGSIWNDREIFDLLRAADVKCFRFGNPSDSRIRFSFRQAFLSFRDVLTPEQLAGFRFVLNRKNRHASCRNRIDGLSVLPGTADDYIFDYPLITANGPEAKRYMAEQGYDAMKLLRERHPECRASIFFNDHFLVGALQYCVENGLMPGKDIHLGCVNGSSAAALSPFPLLMIRHPVEKVIASVKDWLKEEEVPAQCLDMILVRNHAAVRAGLYEGIRYEV